MLDKKSSDFLWKIVLTGDSFVGKTTIRKRAMGEHFAEEYISTVGADFSSYKLRLGDLTIGFQVWDLAGQDKYKYIRSSFYGGATGCFLAYDVTNPKSLKSLSNWVDEAIRYSNGTIEIFIICGNKIDLKDKREISRETGENYANALKESSGLQCAYIETSALTGENVDKAFDIMAKCLLEREGISPIKPIIPPPKVEDKYERFIDVEKLTTPPKPVMIEKVQPHPTTETHTLQPKSKIVSDDTSDSTDLLIAEVMSVLDDTNDVIIGREITEDGEKAITVPKNSLSEKKIREEKPTITPELERVLQVINLKLDSLTNRMKDLEVEINHVKVDLDEDKDEYESSIDTVESSDDQIDLVEDLIKEEEFIDEAIEEEESEEYEEGLPDLIEQEEIEEEEEVREELEIDTDIVEIEEEEPTEQLLEEFDKFETEDTQYDKDQKILESLLELDREPEEPQSDTESLREESKEKQSDPLEELLELPEDELIDIPDSNSIEPIEEEHVPSNESIIGTELTSAMISELKDMSEDAKTEPKKAPIQPLSTEKVEAKTTCSICGQPTKYIRQYNKYYCVKCGRYII